MKKVLVFLCLLSLNLMAKEGEVTNYLSTLAVDGEYLSLFVEGGITSSQRKNSGNYAVNSEIHTLFLATVGMKLFPKTLNLTLSYTSTLDDKMFIDAASYEGMRGESTSDVRFIDVFFKPIVSSYGSLAVGYKNYKYNTTIENALSKPISLDDVPNNGSNPPGYENANQAYLAVGENYGVKSYLQRVSVVYTLPPFDFLPQGSGVSYAKEKGIRPYIGPESVAVKLGLRSERFGVGIYNTFDELQGDGFFFKTLELYQIHYDTKRSKTMIYVDEAPYEASLSALKSDMTFYGFLVEVIYKKSFHNKKFYATAFFDYYQARLSAVLEEGMPATEYSKEHNYMFGFKAGMEFNLFR